MVGANWYQIKGQLLAMWKIVKSVREETAVAV